MGTPENKKDHVLLQGLDNQSGKYRNRTDDLLTAIITQLNIVNTDKIED
jgi:hypothetical protein